MAQGEYISNGFVYEEKSRAPMGLGLRDLEHSGEL